MAEIQTLNENDLEKVLSQQKAALVLFTTGDGLRGDFSTAFRTAAGDTRHIAFACIDPARNPAAAARYGVIGDKPVLLALYCGEEVTRRVRPWGSDVPLAIELLSGRLAADDPDLPDDEEDDEMDSVPQTIVHDDKPVTVTDETFQQEVIDHPLPVLVDFWAPWCGPCRAVAPALEKLAKEFAGQIRIAKVNTDENPMLSQTFRITSIPTIMMLKERTIVFSQPGALPEEAFRDLIQQLIALKLPPREEQTAEEDAE
jgi:thioredoxin 1